MLTQTLKTEADYAAALAHIATLMNAESGSPQEQELERLALLIEQYEQEHYPIDPPNPVDASLFRIEQDSLTQADLSDYIGSQS